MEEQTQQDKKTILIIEDEEEIRVLYAEVLRDADYKVIEAHNGEVGMNRVRDDKWDMLLLDIMLPGEDGVHILKYVKSQPHLRNKPILMLTNLDSEQIINECFDLGADGYLIKSEITPDKIVSEVSNFLNNNE